MMRLLIKSSVILLVMLTPFSAFLPLAFENSVAPPLLTQEKSSFSPIPETSAYAEEMGGVLWSSTKELFGDITVAPVVTYLTGTSDEQVVFLGTDVGLTAIFVATGEIFWVHSTPGAILSITIVQDVTGDDIIEVLLTHSSQLFNNTEMLDGSDGSLLWSFRPTQNYWVDGLGYTTQETKSWSSLELEDLSADGYPEVLITSYNTAFALDGTTGKLLWSFQGANDLWTAILIDDVDSDGYEDVALGSQDGYLYVLSGRDGTLLWQVLASQPESVVIDVIGTVWFDRSVFDLHSVQDVTGDGKRDLLITNENGYCILFDSLTGDSLSRVKVYTRTGEVPAESYYGSKDFYNVVAYLLSSSVTPNSILTLGRSSAVFGNNSFSLLSLSEDGELNIIWTSSSLPSDDIRGVAVYDAEDLLGNYTKVIIPTGIALNDNAREVQIRSLENNSILAQWEIPVYYSSFSEDFEFILNPFIYPFRGNYALLVDNITGSSFSDVLVYFASVGLFALDGETGEELWRQTIAPKVKLEPFTDINDDGTTDILRQKLYYPDNYEQNYLISELAVVSGLTGEILWNFSLPIEELLELGGGFFDLIFTKEDLTGDNITDFWLIARENDELEDLLDNASRIFLLDGATGAVVWEELPADPSLVQSKEQLRITSVTTITDQNGDNITDLLIACERHTLYCMNGLTGESLWNLSRSVPESFPNYRDFLPWSCTLINIGNVLGNETDDIVIIGGDSVVRLVDSDNFSTLHWNLSLGDYWINYNSYSYEYDAETDSRCLVFSASRAESANVVFLNLTSGEPLFIAYGDLNQQIVKLFVADFNHDGYKDHLIYRFHQISGLDAGVYFRDGLTGDLFSVFPLHKPEYEINTWVTDQFYSARLTNYFDILDDIDGDNIPELLLGYSIGRYNINDEGQGMVLEVVSPSTFEAKVIKKFEIMKERQEEFVQSPLYVAPFVKNLGDISGDGFPDILLTFMDYKFEFSSSIVSLDPELATNEEHEEDQSFLWKQINQPVFSAITPAALSGLLNEKLVCTDFFGRIIPLDNNFDVVIDSFEVIKKSAGHYLLSWETNSFTFISEVYVNDLLIAITQETSYHLFLGNNIYNILVAIIDVHGITAYAYMSYKVEQLPSIAVVWIIVGVAIIGYISLKIFVKIKKKEDLTQFGPEINLPR